MSHLPLARLDRVHVEITNRCNLRCAFCAGTTRRPASMDPAFFTHVLDQVRTVSERVSLHVLGEPLLHPGLAAILNSCHGIVTVDLTTNGTLLPGQKDVLLTAPALRQINFSLQALDREDGADEATLGVILAFARQMARRRPEVYVNFRLWTLNRLQDGPGGDFNDRVLDRLALDLDIPRPCPPRGRKSLRLTRRLYLHLDSVFAWPGDLGTAERRRGFCHALTTHCAILADGTVCPCCLDADGRLALGNVADTPLAAILASPRARTMRDGFAAGRLTETICRHCTYCRRFRKNPAAGAA